MTTHEFPNICHRNHRSSRLLNRRNSPFFSCANLDSARDLFPVHVDVDVIAASLSPRCHLSYSQQFSAMAVSIEQEIKDLQLFGYALREENRKLFEQMISELDPDALQKASLAKDPFEVIDMVLIFQQEKMIRELMKEISGKKSI